MATLSFVQEGFSSGAWSPQAQGRMSEPEYQEAMGTCLNSFPTETGPWTRRPGGRYIAHTKGGNAGRVVSFDFSTTQPYQMEFTNGFLRFLAGLALVNVGTPTVLVSTISTANPALVTATAALPASWVNGDTVMFLSKTNPCRSPYLCNRQFIIGGKSGATFTLTDALTGANVNGATINYQAGSNLDEIVKVFELATPYTASQWQDMRVVPSIDNALLLTSAFQPRIILDTPNTDVNPFSIGAQDFTDGPYLDINTTATTLALSALTGSVTVTASGITGINGDTGFQTTDVGRLIRFQAAPAVWSNAITYAQAAVVLGSDNNVYVSVAGANLNQNPTTDNFSAYWELSTETVVWTWLKITARASTTSVTATILGVSPPKGTATTQWRLGLFSDTNGWPTCGTYHDGRLWLSGAASNRVDGSKSNKPFDFSPTAFDGTVADDNAVAATANAVDVNAILWMQTTKEGLLLGSQAGEWLLNAATGEDLISPSTAKMQRVSEYGCANVEPVFAGKNIYVQRQKRKLLAIGNDFNALATSENLSVFASHMTKTGIAELAWQQEPIRTIWARRTDNTLVGCVFKMAQNDASIPQAWSSSSVAWHEHTLGSGNTVVSISAGPSYDGLSDTLYMVTKTAAGKHWVEALLPVFDEQQEDWANPFLDASTSSCCAEKKTIAGGASFDGVRLWGLFYAAGATVVAVIGGLDCGNRVVNADGYVDVPYLSDPEAKFTEAFMDGHDGATVYTPYTTKTTVSGVTKVFPSSVGFTYTSRGQLLRPDSEYNSGLRKNTPYGKKRRVTNYTIELYRSRKVSIGTKITALHPVPLLTEGGTPLAAPGLHSGVVYDTINSDYNFLGQIVWECSRPYNVTVVSIGGDVDVTDK